MARGEEEAWEVGTVRFSFMHRAICTVPVSLCIALKGCMLASEHLQISFLTYWCS